MHALSLDLFLFWYFNSLLLLFLCMYCTDGIRTAVSSLQIFLFSYLLNSLSIVRSLDVPMILFIASLNCLIYLDDSSLLVAFVAI
jgi:hypothetical protein